MKLKHYLPSLYHHLLSQDLLSFEITETKATCDQCIMVTPKKKLWYQNHLKCCTFFPFMPNYLLGAIFKNPNQVAPNTLQAIKSMLTENKSIHLPIGMIAPASYQLAFKLRDEGEFGQREDWLCPYFNKEQNNCGIWRFRGSVCTTFYCHSSHGAKGIRFWEELGGYLNYAEMAFLEEALIRLDFSPRNISDQLAYINIDPDDYGSHPKTWLAPVTLKKLWKGYSDPIEFYIKCFEVVSAFTSEQVEEAFGEMGQKMLNKVNKQGNQINVREAK